MDKISLIDNDLIQLIKYKKGKIREPNQVSMVDDKICMFFLSTGNKELFYEFVLLYFWNIKKSFSFKTKLKISLKYIFNYWTKKQVRIIVFRLFRVKLKI